MFYIIIRPFLYLFMLIFFPRKIYGRENIVSGGQIVVCNHLAKIDIFFIGSIFKNKVYFLSKKELYKNKLFAIIIRALGGVPVNREKLELSTYKEVLSLLSKGEKLVIFPEGTRNKVNEELQELKAGAGVFAIKGKVPILPIIIEKHCKVFHKNRVLVGKPLYLDEYIGKRMSGEDEAVINAKIREAMLETQRELRLMPIKKENKKLCK